MASRPADVGVDAAALLRGVLEAPPGTRRALREQFLARPAAEAVPLLIEAADAASGRVAFDRAARLLAQFATPGAVEALVRHAQGHRRFDGLALRALGGCAAPAAVDALVGVLETRGVRRRCVAARALSATGSPRAIEPLCAAAADRSPTVRRAVLAAVQRMGRPEALARRVLAEPSFHDTDHVRVLEGLARVRTALWVRRLDVERFLTRERADRRSPVRAEAEAALRLLLARRTLVRAAGPSGDAALLRAAGGPPEAGGTGLLRPAEGPQPEAAPAVAVAAWRRVWRRLRRRG